eukprot:CAMPEP_0114631564 /NCGR_PEP_ID=MMETSP0168-20121206/14477_1 /TAXON_ID=95228 ORGANISM="Vannella sp., Strain DIVA3 517/6/12" /NCGR_SAMPLE_ID=MMETSP0168 /ASSEMBLY_ACC=CAM_ASM_000044 /LENGTH=553 /DNA_ID=CAMNT_0001843133 /DNA_START=11 /DNA_END=1670 /DNA_ORIENTATION=-
MTAGGYDGMELVASSPLSVCLEDNTNEKDRFSPLGKLLLARDTNGRNGLHHLMAARIEQRERKRNAHEQWVVQHAVKMKGVSNGKTIRQTLQKERKAVDLSLRAMGRDMAVAALEGKDATGRNARMEAAGVEDYAPANPRHAAFIARKSREGSFHLRLWTMSDHWLTPDKRKDFPALEVVVRNRWMSLLGELQRMAEAENVVEEFSAALLHSVIRAKPDANFDFFLTHVVTEEQLPFVDPSTRMSLLHRVSSTAVLAHLLAVDKVTALLDTTDKMGLTPLQRWCQPQRDNKLRCAGVALLLTAGADPSLSLRARELPLFLCVADREQETFKSLVSAGADVNARAENGRSLFSFPMDSARAELLLHLGFDVTSLTDNGRTAVMEQCAVARECDPNGVLGTLVDYGCDINAVDTDGRTALHLAPAMAEVLLGLSARPDILTLGGVSPLISWVRGVINRDLTAAHVPPQLFRCGMVDHLTPDHHRAIQYLLDNDDHLPLLLELLVEGANPCQLPGERKTPLRIACEARCRGATMALLRYGALDGIGTVPVGCRPFL